ncbi:MAG: sigma 54-interacting transcriptional regulator [Polyangiaceae bacterium]|nr:sigma 54-interacting transcriptional regulator [Polyangiaceae bacterium]
MSTLLTVAGRTLRVLEHVGQGATSIVFRAADVATGAALVLKVARNARDTGAFLNEAERHARVRCPELVPLVGVGRIEGVSAEGPTTVSVLPGGPALLFPWIEGEDLTLSFRPESKYSSVLGPEGALLVAWELGRALDELHEMGQSHGDLKPSNVMLTGNAFVPDTLSVQLIDLGLGVDATERVPRGGTPRYLDPDLLSGRHSGEARARDLFALGLLLAEISEPALAASQDLQQSLRLTSLDSRVQTLVGPLVRSSPSARPSARWVWQRAGQMLGRAQSVESIRAWRRRRARAAYLKARASDLSVVWGTRPELQVSTLETEWLADFLSISAQVGSFSETPRGAQLKLHELNGTGLTAFLVHLIGPVASDWPVGLLGPVPAALERVRALLDEYEPAQLTFAMLQPNRVLSSVTPPASFPTAEGLGKAEERLVSMTLELSDPGKAWAALTLAELTIAAGQAPPALVALTATRLRQVGQLGRALVLTEESRVIRDQVFAAETYRRARDPKKAEAIADRIRGSGVALSVDELAQLSATSARILLDRGELEAAFLLIDSAPPLSVVWETRAQIEVARGHVSEALACAERAKASARSDEELARAEAVLGFAAHQAGNSDLELLAYQRASEYAARAGAVIEEAHYLTGVAAASVQVGAYEHAQKSARRARLLFDWSERGAQAARAAQAEAAVFAALGAREEAEDCAREAEQRAKLAGDVLCRAYVHLTLSDVHASGRRGREHAERAQQLFGEKSSPADSVRVAARLLRHGAPVAISSVDSLALNCGAVDALFEWWGARAQDCAKRRDVPVGALVVTELLGLSAKRAPAAVRGPSLVAGAHLASELGDGDAARRLFAGANEAARQVLAAAPESLRARIEALDWIQRCQTVGERALLPEQLSDVEGLIRALGGRENRRLLFERILDMLVLWTGVERALLLLPAPNGKLMVRAARNLARHDLEGAQLELSRSLAQRALDEGAPVVAVDAQFDLPEVHASVHALKLRSVLAVPLVAHGQKLGVVYLDDRIKRGAFGPQELGWVRVIASLAAIALGDMRAELLLRRSLRRASRAEARVRSELGRREAELEVAQRELAQAHNGRNTRYAYDAIVGESEPIVRLLSLIDRVAGSDIPVLVLGESGTGKELVARALHSNSPRASGPYVSENCSAIPETLLESALFGHVRGAFTGASHTRAGLFDAADGGTLFLDEVAEMSLGMQTKLLRVLEDGLVKPVGSERTRKVNVRVLAATHRDLEARVESGAFRKDLYYRLNVVTLKVPALRERPGDVALLIKHFIAQYSPEKHRRLSRGAEGALLAYPWPGNVRQLQNEIRRALLMADDTIELSHLSPQIIGTAPSDVAGADSVNLKVRVDAMERQLVTLALERTGGNQTRAAEMLGVSRFGLQKMLKRLEIEAKN